MVREEGQRSSGVEYHDGMGVCKGSISKFGTDVGCQSEGMIKCTQHVGG